MSQDPSSTSGRDRTGRPDHGLLIALGLGGGEALGEDHRWTLTFDPFLLRADDRHVDSDDERLLPSLGIAGRILTTPGQTVDHFTLLLGDGSASCGDAAANMLGLAGTRHCAACITDMEQAYGSWPTLLAAGATTLCPAHGGPFAAEDLIADLDAIHNEQLVPFF